jgi:hypothetical protein
MGQQSRIGKVATTVKRDAGGTLRVTYHSTVIVEVSPEGRVTLDHNGWKTATTKTRMNQASNQFGLGYSVWQRKGGWFIHHNGSDISFDVGPVTL